MAGTPEKKDMADPPWAVPISPLRIPTDEKATDIAVLQIEALLNDS
ncbi:hypothetical protein QUF90_23855 [Desulfococcaceae bacterium HSG9]|nr:hypothetical protein [Desulfococcaceae bacterium HSG9]